MSDPNDYEIDLVTGEETPVNLDDVDWSQFGGFQHDNGDDATATEGE